MDPIQTQNPYNLVWDAQAPVQVAQIPMPPVQPVQAVPPVAWGQVSAQQTPKSEGFLEKVVKWIVRFIAKASGNPDPITGQGGVPKAQPTQAGWLLGQIGWVFTGIAETAQGMVGDAVTWAKQIWQSAVTWAQQIWQSTISGVQQVGQTITQATQQAPAPTVQPVPPVQEPVQVPPTQ